MDQPGRLLLIVTMNHNRCHHSLLIIEQIVCNLGKFYIIYASKEAKTKKRKELRLTKEMKTWRNEPSSKMVQVMSKELCSQSLELVPNFGLIMFTKQANQIYHYVCEMKKQLFFMDLTGGLVNFPLIAIIKFVALLHSVCPLLP